MESLKRYRFCIYALLTIGGILLACYYTPSKHHDNTNCAEIASSLSANDLRAYFENEIGVPDNLVTNNKEQGKEYQEEALKNAIGCSELKAQWTVADITFWAFCAGIFGIILIALTWYATKEAVKVTRQAAKDELRAYLAIESIRAGTDRDERGHFYSVEIKVKNIGQTPAYNLVIDCVPYTHDDWESREFLPNQATKLQRTVTGYLPHGHDSVPISIPVIGSKIAVTRDDAGGFNINLVSKKNCIVVGSIHFDDIYTKALGEGHHRTFKIHRFGAVDGGKTIKLKPMGQYEGESE